jgi:hypothetical protein
MSRILGGLIALSVAAPAYADSSSAALKRYADKTSVIVRCIRPAGEQIVVCGRRAADKWRVPFIGYAAGDPDTPDVMGEREKWQHKTTPCQNLSVFLVGCGSVGVSVSTRLDGSGPRLRKIAD